MKYAYVHKNFRELNFEKKFIFGAHLLTIVLCFFPWFEANPLYDETLFRNAFQGPGFLIGALIFVLSLVICLFFVDRLLERQRIKLPFNENYLYGIAGAQQILLLTLMWSVLFFVGRDFGEHQIRFGIFLTLVAQIAGLVATFLNQQLVRQSEIRGFFQHPGPSERNTESEE